MFEICIFRIQSHPPRVSELIMAIFSLSRLQTCLIYVFIPVYWAETRQLKLRTSSLLFSYWRTSSLLFSYWRTSSLLFSYWRTSSLLFSYWRTSSLLFSCWWRKRWWMDFLFLVYINWGGPYELTIYLFFFFSFYLYQGFVQNFPTHVSNVLWSTYTGFALSVWYIIGCSGTPLETLGISHWKCTNSNLFGGWSSKIMFTLPLWEIIQDHPAFNTLRLRQNSRHIPDNIFKWIFLNENIWILSLFLGVQLVIFQHWFR